MEKRKKNLIKKELKLSKNFYQKCTRNSVLLKRRMMMSKKLLIELIILENLFLQFLHLILSEVEKIHLQYIYIWVFLINIKYEPIYRTLNKQINKHGRFFPKINIANINIIFCFYLWQLHYIIIFSIVIILINI